MTAGKKLWRNRKERKEWARRLQSEDPGLEVVHPHAAGIDVGNNAHYVAVRPDRDQEPVRRFECFTADLHGMADWLQSCGVKSVAMQSTGVYWIPPLNYVGINKRNRAHRYYSTVKRCRGCGQKPQCTRGKFRTIAIHICEAARQKAEEVAKTPEFAVALRKRRKVEALFAELKNYIGLRRLRLRRMRFVREQFYLAATAQNLKRLVRFLSSKPTPQIATA